MFENLKNITNGVVVAIASPGPIALKVVEKLQSLFRELDVSLGVHLRSDINERYAGSSLFPSTVEKLSRVDEAIRVAKSLPRLTLLNYAIHEFLVLGEPGSIDQSVAKLVTPPDFVFHIVTTDDENDHYNTAIRKMQWGKHRVALSVSDKSTEDIIADMIFGMLITQRTLENSGINYL